MGKAPTTIFMKPFFGVSSHPSAEDANGIKAMQYAPGRSIREYIAQ